MILRCDVDYRTGRASSFNDPLNEIVHQLVLLSANLSLSGAEAEAEKPHKRARLSLRKKPSRLLTYESNWNHRRLTSKMRPHLPLVKDIPNSKRHKNRILNAIDCDDTSRSIPFNESIRVLKLRPLVYPHVFPGWVSCVLKILGSSVAIRRLPKYLKTS